MKLLTEEEIRTMADGFAQQDYHRKECKTCGKVFYTKRDSGRCDDCQELLIKRAQEERDANTTAAKDFLKGTVVDTRLHFSFVVLIYADGKEATIGASGYDVEEMYISGQDVDFSINNLNLEDADGAS